MRNRRIAAIVVLAVTLAGVGCGSSSVSTSAPAAPTATTTTIPTAPANRAPVINAITVSPGVGLQASTTLTFAANATDADGDPLQYQWAFGDGAMGGGQSVTHLYQSGGTMTVSLAVTDAKATTTKETPVPVVSLSGIWWSPDPCGAAAPVGTVPCENQQGVYFTITQAGSKISGSEQVFTLASGSGGSAFFNVNPVSGSVTSSSPRINLDVTGTSASGGTVPVCYTLEPNADVTELSGQVAGGACGGTPVTPRARNPFVRTTTVPHP